MLDTIIEPYYCTGHRSNCKGLRFPGVISGWGYNNLISYSPIYRLAQS